MTEQPKLNLTKNMQEFARGKKLTPGGVLGIRRPYNFVEGEYPIYFDRAEGSKVIDIDGNEYIDYLCAYGPIILGYKEKEVDDAAIHQIRENGFCFSLTQEIQNNLAEKLIKIIPSAEMCIFTKTGSDATSVAVRLARGYTNRKKIFRCGYHGWADWCVEVKGGVPEKLYEDVHEFPYNDLETLETMLKTHGSDTAAIIITPLGHPLAKQVEEPKPGYLEGVRKLADQYGVVLIFDEIRTGFRLSLGGAQELYNVTPDLSTFGKALANGYAVSAVVGKKEVMKKAEKDVFISSTFFPNSIAFAAALKTLEILERDNVLDIIKKKGDEFNASMKKVFDKYDVDISLSKVPQMPYVVFNKDQDGLYKKRRNDFYTQLIRRKVFLQPYHHGYICYRHTKEELDYTINAIDESMQYITNKKY